MSLTTCNRGHGERWNVLLITLDTTRADVLGAYGSTAGNSPRIDGLAATGTVFELAISTSALTPVSHASILTGRDNRGHGLRTAAGRPYDRLRDDVPTLATVLRDHGYQTVGIGSSFTVSRHFGLQRGFDRFEDLLGERTDARTWDVGALQRRADETVDRVLPAIDASTAPFCLWLHFWDPHDPYRVPPREYLPENLPLTEDMQLYESPELYRAEVRFMDAQLGRVLDHLRGRGQLDHTLVVVVADHGEGLGDHGWPYHHLLYQEQIRVPLLICVPGLSATPRVKSLVRTTDILPTVLDFLGVPAPRGVDGHSLRPCMTGAAGEPRIGFADAIIEYDLNSMIQLQRPLDDHLYCAMDAEWKLIYRPTRPQHSELYDLRTDPRETLNRLADQPQVVERLLRALAFADPWVVDPPEPMIDPEVTNALNQLGYPGPRERAAPRNWNWSCPQHRDLNQAQRGICPECSNPLVPSGLRES